jgi:CO/xanthine dehydrogenase FAD-binding subunit
VGNGEALVAVAGGSVGRPEVAVGVAGVVPKVNRLQAANASGETSKIERSNFRDITCVLSFLAIQTPG